jgi:hypothetical protein
MFDSGCALRFATVIVKNRDGSSWIYRGPVDKVAKDLRPGDYVSVRNY